MKKFVQKKVAVLINPLAAANQPVLSILNTAFLSQGIEWRAFVSNKGDDLKRLTRTMLATKPDVIYVLGGDGTQCEAMKGLGSSPTPLALLPAGTANIMGKELGIPLDLAEALSGYVRASGVTRPITKCLVGNKPFFLRLSIGVLAEMIVRSSRKKKQQLGMLAYPLSALEAWQESPIRNFRFRIDEKLVETKGISLLINNFGNVGFPGISFLPIIDPSDQYLDVIVIQAEDVASLVAVAKTTLADNQPNHLMQHWRARKVEIALPEKTALLLDDEKVEVSSLTAQVTDRQVRCLLPKENP